MDGQKSLLLIDDDETFLRHAARFLEKNPTYRIAAMTTDAKQGVEHARETQPDVILLDLSMPNLSGTEAMPLLQEAAPNARIVVLTMFEADSYRQLAMSKGANGYVTKSRLVDDLVDEINRQCGENSGHPPSYTSN